MIFKRKRDEEKTLIAVPFKICGFKAGDMIPLLDFVNVIDFHIQNLEDEIAEKDSEIDDLKAEIDGLNSDIEEFYKAKDPYYLNGVFQEDFH